MFYDLKEDEFDGNIHLTPGQAVSLICSFNQTYNPGQPQLYTDVVALKKLGKTIGCDDIVFNEVMNQLNPKFQMFMKACSLYDDVTLHKIIRTMGLGILYSDALQAVVNGVTPEKYVENLSYRLEKLKLPHPSP